MMTLYYVTAAAFLALTDVPSSEGVQRVIDPPPIIIHIPTHAET